MGNIFQRIFGTKRGAAIANQPSVRTLENDLLTTIANESPTAQRLVQFVGTLWPQPQGTAIPGDAYIVTPDEFNRLEAALNATLSALGVPTTDEAQFLDLFKARLEANGFQLPSEDAI